MEKRSFFGCSSGPHPNLGAAKVYQAREEQWKNEVFSVALPIRILTWAQPKCTRRENSNGKTYHRKPVLPPSAHVASLQEIYVHSIYSRKIGTSAFATKAGVPIIYAERSSIGRFYKLVLMEVVFYLAWMPSRLSHHIFCFSFGHVARYAPSRKAKTYGTIAANTSQANL